MEVQAIGPEETRLVDLNILQKQGLPHDANWANVSINYTGRPGDLVPIAASYDSTTRYGLQSPFSSTLASMWKGGMWHVDPLHDSLITTGNAGTSKAKIVITLFYGQTGAYEMPGKDVAPGGQLWIDVGQLIQDQVADAHGRTIPPEITDGSYEIRDENDKNVGYLYEGKVITDKTFGHATYGCGGCCGYDDSYMLPDPMIGPMGSGGKYTVYGVNACTGQGIALGGASNWKSTVQSVATVDSTGYLTMISPGATNVSSVINLRTAGVNNCPPLPYYPSAPGNVVNLSCSPSPITRGSTITCTLSASSGVGASNWQFSDGVNPAVLRGTNTTSLTWSGVIVTSGTVSVTASVSGASVPLSYPVTVNARSGFSFTAVSPVQNAGTNSITCYKGTTTTLVSPPNLTSIKGASCADLAFSFIDNQVIDNGPNNGYRYVTSATDSNGSQPTQFPYIVVSDLLSATTFYNAQCGNYSSTNSTGFIAGSQLKQNVFDHEQGPIFSHWTEYRDAQNIPSNNVGTVLEAMTAPPGTAQSTYEGQLNSAGSNAQNNIDAAASIEPCNEDPTKDSSQSCAECGAINYSPYQPCNGQPVPYCH